MSDKEEDKERCPECGGMLIVEENKLRCEKCGLILEEDYLNRKPDWRAFSSEERDKKKRSGPPVSVTKHDKGLSTEIGSYGISGEDFSPEKRRYLSRLRRLHSQSRRLSGKERSLSVGFQELHRISTQLSLSKSVHEFASVIYKVASDKNLIKGRSIESIAAAALYIACRYYNVPRTLDEFKEVARVSKKKIARAERFLVKNLDVSLEPTSPVDYIPRFVSKVGLGKDVEDLSNEIAEKAMEEGVLSGRSPVSIAVASIYIAARRKEVKMTQRELSEVSGVSVVTIRKRFHEIEEILGS
ncbi:MAG: Transcription initiation factor TFIIB family [Candidatus Methanohalarchaeum thermophilum]|uniref:Transcription initiation factor IIB n=1 Tax=Methanohalarchaeum thermophilum TaxID=1903181 RepID=A0A1Q6DUW7_METT1|nr:MAG: Transcription initiation factor TFIIB family [Candidatus Methanohalarchaeum thermophilum]